MRVIMSPTTRQAKSVGKQIRCDICEKVQSTEGHDIGIEGEAIAAGRGLCERKSPGW